VPPVKRPDEVRALSRLAFDELGGFIGGIGAIQRGASHRAFRAVGWGAKPAEFVYTGVTTGVYAALRGASRAVSNVADSALGRRDPGDGRLLSSNPVGSFAVAVIDGLIGDALEEQHNDLAEQMGVRVDGRVVEPRPAALVQAFPQATPRVDGDLPSDAGKPDRGLASG
jgi:hypothetical protein